MNSDQPMRLAGDVWWVGARLDDDLFQCHAYFIDNGDDSVLLDPGSPLTIGQTLDKVAQIADVDSIRYLVCHHPDPDIAASLPWLSDLLTRHDVEVVTEWRAQALLKHYGHRFDYYRVEEHDWKVPLGAGRDLEFQLTPYLHFPGAMVSYDTGTRTLFSSDLFGGFVPDTDCAGVARPGLHRRSGAAVPSALHAQHRAADRGPVPGSSSAGPTSPDRPAARPRHPRRTRRRRRSRR